MQEARNYGFPDEPPHKGNGMDVRHEVNALGCVILNGARALAEVRQLQGKLFDKRCEKILEAMLRLEAAGKPPEDVELLATELGSGLPAVGGLEFLVNLAGWTVTGDNVSWYVAEVLKEHARREAILLAAEVKTQAAEADNPAEMAYLFRAAAEKLESPGLQLGVIRGSWRAVEQAWLTDAPDARKWLLKHPTYNEGPCAPGHGDGLLPLGKVGILASEGGVGKTHLLLALAVAIAAGRRWLGHFDVGYDARYRKVLLGLAEEDAEECHRRLFSVSLGFGLDPDECRRVAERVVVLPLAGKPVGLVDYAPDGRRLVETAELHALRAKLTADAGKDGWGLVALDPLSRWAGPDVESDNAVATRFLQAVETLTSAPGNPSVLVSHHSSKMARRTGDADSRGVTGLTDGARWAATLRQDGATIFFRQTKSNYSKPMLEDLPLMRSPEGLIRAQSSEDEQRFADAKEARIREREDARVAAVAEALYAAIRAAKNPPRTREDLYGLVTGSHRWKVTAIARLLASGQIRKGQDGYEAL